LTILELLHLAGEDGW